MLLLRNVLPTTVATPDALHLATALHLCAAGLLDAVMTHDVRLAEAAEQQRPPGHRAGLRR